MSERQKFNVVGRSVKRSDMLDDAVGFETHHEVRLVHSEPMEQFEMPSQQAFAAELNQALRVPFRVVFRKPGAPARGENDCMHVSDSQGWAYCSQFGNK